MPKIHKSEGHVHLHRYAPYVRNEVSQPVPRQAEQMLPLLNHDSIIARIQKTEVELKRLELERDGLIRALNITGEREGWLKTPNETTNENGELQRKLGESITRETLWKEKNDYNLRKLESLTEDHEALLTRHADKKNELKQVRLCGQSKINRLEDTIKKQAKELQSLKNKGSNT